MEIGTRIKEGFGLLPSTRDHIIATRVGLLTACW
jgi:hypothetical protein